MLLINLLINLPHDEVYQNEISRSLPSLLFSVICCYCHLYSDEKMFGELKSEIKNLRKVRVCTFLRLKLLISAGKN